MSQALQPLPTKSGIAKISGGAQQYGIPTRMSLTGQSVTTLNVNEVRYVPFYCDYPVTLTAWQFEVTTAPTSNANIRLGVYQADTNLQPSGAPLYDSGSVAVANGFTGVKSASSLSIALARGVYLAAMNTDTSQGVRTLLSGTPIVAASLGASALVQRLFIAQTYGAFPTPGAAWTGISQGTGGLQHFVAWEWTE